MNEQKPPNAIEWTRVWGRKGYTWNPIAGCHHDCKWRMPDGAIATCYAADVANGVARNAYPYGFGSHYYHPSRLNEPLKVKEPAGIFLDSMSDLMGHWVPEEQIQKVFDVVRKADQHIFFLLTKNAPRLRKFNGQFPKNLWVGASMPPTFFMGKELRLEVQERMLLNALDILADLKATTWMSFEPLSFDAAPVYKRAANALDWAVIGAASRGNKTYQPDPKHVTNLLRVLDMMDVPVFFKGNLEWPEWREEFPPEPSPVVTEQLRLW